MSLIIVFTNISKLAPVSDYEYQVRIGSGGALDKILDHGLVTGHLRADGWKQLVRKILDKPDNDNPVKL